MSTKLRTLFWIGIVLLFLPHIGVTDNTKGIITIVLGVVVIAITFAIGRNYKKMRLMLRRFEQTTSVDQSIHTEYES